MLEAGFKAAALAEIPDSADQRHNTDSQPRNTDLKRRTLSLAATPHSAALIMGASPEDSLLAGSRASAARSTEVVEASTVAAVTRAVVTGNSVSFIKELTIWSAKSCTRRI
jgi:hypothetical protein